MLRSVKRLLVSMGILSGFITLLAFGSPVFAVTAADWDPANIMDDGIFFSPGEMSTSDIQSFLNSKVPVCDTNHAPSQGNNPPFTCLKDYFENPTTHQNNANGGVVTGGWSAAQIIKHAADSYNINPKVLIVLLQKEQSLITDDWPFVAQYRSATGFGCPDTAPCDAEYYGFYNQVMNAARQFRRYATFPTEYRYKAFRSNYIQYNPNTSCGGTNVTIANQATAGLYNYTPYQPNAGALANLYGSSDCGAYGNRNFWRMFSDWFGSTTATFSTKDTDVSWGFENLIGKNTGIINSADYTGGTPASIEHNGILYVFYYNFTTRSLDMVYADNTGWHKVVIDGGGGVASGKSNNDVGLHPSATVYNNEIYVSYYDNTSGDLRYVKGAVGAWTSSNLDGSGGSDGRVSSNVGTKSKLLNYGGSLQLFYYDSGNNNLRHAWGADGQNWRFENLDGDAGSVARNNGDVGSFMTAVDYNGSLQLFYYDSGNNNLRHAWANSGQGWRFENLDGDAGSVARNNGNVGAFSSVVNAAGTLQLFYYDSGNNNLRHAWAGGGQGWKFENLDGDNGSIARNNGDAGVDVNASFNPTTGKLRLVYKHGMGIKYAWSNISGWHFAYLDGTSYSLTGQTFAPSASNPIILPYGQSLQVFYSHSGVLKHAWGT